MKRLMWIWLVKTQMMNVFGWWKELICRTWVNRLDRNLSFKFVILIRYYVKFSFSKSCLSLIDYLEEYKILLGSSATTLRFWMGWLLNMVSEQGLGCGLGFESSHPGYLKIFMLLSVWLFMLSACSDCSMRESLQKYKILSRFIQWEGVLSCIRFCWGFSLTL